MSYRASGAADVAALPGASPAPPGASPGSPAGAPAPPAAGPARPAPAPVPSRRARGRAAALAARHWPAALLLTVGLALRITTQAAYRPALLYIDSMKYLFHLWPGTDPLGYALILRPLLAVGSLGTVAAVQHLLGLAIAVVLYALLLRRGASRWLAALAMAPVLLDAYQLQIEQTIMPDVWFEAMLTAGLAVLAWRRRVTFPAVIAAGLILGASATVRQVGEVLIVPAALYVLIAAWPASWRGAGRAGAALAGLAVAFAAPILAYCAVSAVQTGQFALAAGSPVSGRLAEAADCATLRVPADVRVICPTPAEQAKGIDFLDHDSRSPLHSGPVPPGTSRAHLVSLFDAAVERQQPLRVLGSVAGDSARLFAVSRATGAGVLPVTRWQFQRAYPAQRPVVTIGAGGVIIIGLKQPGSPDWHFAPLAARYGGPAQVSRPAAAFLRAYQLGGGYTPGPLLAVAALAALAGSLLVFSRRNNPRGRGLAQVCLLLFAASAAVLLASDFYEFSWRYQLPALVTLVPAGALGLAACWERATAARRRRALAAAMHPHDRPSG